MENLEDVIETVIHHQLGFWFWLWTLNILVSLLVSPVHMQKNSNCTIQSFFFGEIAGLTNHFHILYALWPYFQMYVNSIVVT